MIYESGFRGWLVTFALGVIAVLVSVSNVDRPTAEFFNTHVRHTELWKWLDRLLAPFVLVPVVALLFLFGVGCWLLTGLRLSVWTLKPLLYSWSAVWALAAEFVFKEVFCRAWPDPGYVEKHLYGFRFLQGGPHWNSFPSGTATISAALVATVWLVAPRLRLPSAFVAAFLCSGVVITNGHWLSDVMAGVFLGASIGWMTVLLLGSKFAAPPLPYIRPHTESL